MLEHVEEDQEDGGEARHAQVEEAVEVRALGLRELGDERREDVVAEELACGMTWTRAWMSLLPGGLRRMGAVCPIGTTTTERRDSPVRYSGMSVAATVLYTS